MKKTLALVLALLMMLTVISSLAEEKEEAVQAQTQVEQSVEELTTSEEEEAYKKYFEKAFVIVKYTRNVSINIGNFFYIAGDNSYTKKYDYSFLKDLNSPLELTRDQMKMLSKYKTTGEDNKDYRSYISSSLAAAVHFSKTLPAYLTVFSLLEKPAVPEKYQEVDKCIEDAISEAQQFYDAFAKYLNKESTDRPDYNEMYFNYLDVINDVL